MLFSVFVWCHHTFHSDVSVPSDKRPYRTLTFHNVLARPGSSFCNRVHLNFRVFALRDTKVVAQDGCRVGQKMSSHFSFCLPNSACSRRSIFFNVLGSLEQQFLVSTAKLSARCSCYFTAAIFVPLGRTQTWHLHTKFYNARMKNSEDLIFGDVVNISNIYRIQIFDFIHWTVNYNNNNNK